MSSPVKPSRPARKSLSSAAIPSQQPTFASTSTSSSATPGPSSTSTSTPTSATRASKRKRAASFAPGDTVGLKGGPAAGKKAPSFKLGGAGSSTTLSPGKVARRVMVPRKSILKAYNPDDVTQNFTTGHIGLGGRRASDESDEDEDDDDENETQFRRLPGESTTRMMDRRVSFAAHAHVRMFEIDNRNALSQSTSSIGSTSIGNSNPSTPAPVAPKTNIFATPATPAPLLAVPAPSFAAVGASDDDDLGTDDGLDMTTAGGGIARPTPLEGEDDDTEDMSFDEDELDLTVAGGGIAALVPETDEDATEDFDDEDDGGLDFTTAGGGIAGPVEEEVGDETEEMDFDDEEGLDMTVAGGGIAAPSVPMPEEDETEDLEFDDGGMDLTTAGGGIAGPPVFGGEEEDAADVSLDLTVASGGITRPSQAQIISEEDAFFDQLVEQEDFAPKQYADEEEDDNDNDNPFDPSPLEAQPVSLSQFLDMTGLNFMTNITAGRRRSTLQPGEMLGLHRKAVESTGRSGGEYQLVDYANHVLNMQDYVVYHWACNNLREATEKSRNVVQVLDEEASIANPLLFSEYLQADDDEKRMIETQLKHLKTYAQHTVKKRWLEWRLDILTPLKAGHENDRRDLLEDRARLAELKATFDEESNLDQLRAKHAALKLQLAQEKQKVEDVQACDQQELAHRRSDIQEQKDQIDGVKSEMHDVNVVVASLQAKKESILAQQKTYLEAIEFGKSASAGSFTAERLGELEDEVQTLELLHSIQLTSRSATHLELLLFSDVKLSLVCEGSIPVTSGATVELVGSQRTKRNPEFGVKVFDLIRRSLAEEKFDTVTQLVQRVYLLWLATIRISHELHLIRLRYPITYSTPSGSVVRATAPVMICPIRSKFEVSFDFDVETLASWPSSTDKLGVHVDIKYSKSDVKAEAHVLKDVIVSRLKESERCAGALVDGCLDAVGKYC